MEWKAFPIPHTNGNPLWPGWNVRCGVEKQFPFHTLGIVLYSSPHNKVPTTLEYYVGSRLEVASILRSYGVLRSLPTAYYSAHLRGVAVA